MKRPSIKFKLNYLLPLFMLALIFSCDTTKKEKSVKNGFLSTLEIKEKDTMPFFNHWNLILGNGENVGQATTYRDSSYFLGPHLSDCPYVASRFGCLAICRLVLGHVPRSDLVDWKVYR